MKETKVLLAGSASLSLNRDDDYVRELPQRAHPGADGVTTQPPKMPIPDGESMALKKELTKKAIEKWSKVNAPEDHEEEDSFKVRHLFKDCTIAQLQRIVDLDLAVGYDKESTKDKMDFFNKLPQADKDALLRDFKAQKE